jgi:hypothetical protein
MNNLKPKIRQQGLTTAVIVTNIIIVVVLASTAFGYYHNYRIDNAVAAALAVGEEHKGLIEAFFEEQGQMPQSEAEADLDRFQPAGILEQLRWRPGIPYESQADELLTGTIHAVVDMDEFGKRFEEYKSGYFLIARAQVDGSIVWDCKHDGNSKDGLPRLYLPESCVIASDSEEGEITR